MERALIRQYEADMAEVLTKLDGRTQDAIVALAELPLQIRGFGPVKMKNAQKAKKQRENLLDVIRQGGQDVAKAAQ
ncbi:MAG: DUF6537 domain-containing protein, partial [Roseovarius sp.]